MEIKVGDIVKLKSVEQLMQEGWFRPSSCGKKWLEHKDSLLSINDNMVDNYLGKEFKVAKVTQFIDRTNFFLECDDFWVYDELMVEYVRSNKKPIFKVGDKVRLKTLDEILKLDVCPPFRFDLDGDLMCGGNFALCSEELRYCGEEFEISEFTDRYHADIKNKKLRIDSVPIKLLDPVIEVNLVDLNQATIALVNGECDVIRYHENVSICAYVDEDNGGFKVAKYRGEGAPLKYTDEPFFMHEDYIVNSKWELIVDNVKRQEVEEQKNKLISSAEILYLLGKLDYETYSLILNKTESIK